MNSNLGHSADQAFQPIIISLIIITWDQLQWILEHHTDNPYPTVPLLAVDQTHNLAQLVQKNPFPHQYFSQWVLMWSRNGVARYCFFSKTQFQSLFQSSRGKLDKSSFCPDWRCILLCNMVIIILLVAAFLVSYYYVWPVFVLPLVEKTRPVGKFELLVTNLTVAPFGLSIDFGD